MLNAYQDGFTVVPNDTTQISFSGIYVGGAGNVVITSDKGNVVTFNAVPVGTILRIRGTKVMVASTATLMTGLL